jgi:DNA-binding response OmpR family regulator
MSYTVLIVEDDAMLSEALSDKFGRAGFTAQVAKDGAEGLSMAESTKPSCILLDIVMPKMHGIEMLKRMRAESWGSGIPVIVLSNLSAGQDIEEVKKYGIEEFFVKAQCKLDDLLARVNGMLEQKKPA